MKALVLAGSPDTPGVTMARIDRPDIQPGQLLIEPIAVGVTGMEPHWRPNWLERDGTARRGPVVLGHEFSGRIAGIGSGVDGFRVGQRVFGMIDAYNDGAIAETVSVASDEVIHLPYRLNAFLAATMPLAGLTAWQALMEHGALEKGQTVLVHGGAGGVGSFALQIARWAGARVITTAAAEARDFCLEFGADHVIDFQRQRFEDHVADIDLVFDPIGGDVQERSWGVLKRGGRLVTIAGEVEDAPDQSRAESLGVSAMFFIVSMNRKQLKVLTSLVIEGKLFPIVDKYYLFPECRQAFQQGKPRTTFGKAVIIGFG